MEILLNLQQQPSTNYTLIEIMLNNYLFINKVTCQHHFLFHIVEHNLEIFQHKNYPFFSLTLDILVHENFYANISFKICLYIYTINYDFIIGD